MSSTVVGTELPGADTSGTESSGVELLGADTSGTESSGVELLGVELLGVETSGVPARVLESSIEVEGCCFTGVLEGVLVGVLVETSELLVSNVGDGVRAGAGVMPALGAKNAADAGRPNPTTAIPAVVQTSDFFMMISCGRAPSGGGTLHETAPRSHGISERWS
jgi:hypothetical protein